MKRKYKQDILQTLGGTREGLTIYEIAKEINSTWPTTRKYVKELVRENKIKSVDKRCVLKGKEEFDEYRCEKIVKKKLRPILYDGKQYSVRIPNKFIREVGIDPTTDAFEFSLIFLPTVENPILEVKLRKEVNESTFFAKSKEPRLRKEKKPTLKD